MEVPGKRTDTDDEAENVASLDKLCEPCKVDNVNTQASGFCKECEEYMCTVCFRQHLRLTLCRHHTLMDINATSETCLKRNSRATKCTQHDGETIKYYCRKHEAVGCGDCLVSNHNACKPEFITDLSEHFQQDEAYRTFSKQLEKSISDGKEIDKKIRENKKDNKVMLEKALGDIKQVRLDINKYLDKAEKDIICKVRNIMEENDALLTKLENDCTTLSTKLEEITKMIDSELYKDNDLFIHTVKCKPKLIENEKAISDMKTKSMKKYEFVCDEQLRSLVTSAQKLGTLIISSSTIFPQTTDQSNEKNKSQRNAGNNAEGTHKRGNIREGDVEGGYKEEKAGVRSVIAVGARVQHNSWKDWRWESGVGPVAGTVTAVPEDGTVTVKWDYTGRSGRYRVGEGDRDVTLIKS